jgi:hypothetical protein
MSEHIATTSQSGCDQSPNSSTPQPTTLHPAEIGYIVQVIPVDNPLGLKALEHLRIHNVWQVLVDHEHRVVQRLGLMSSFVQDNRYIVN